MSNHSTATDVKTFLGDLNGGVLAEAVGHILSSVALGVVEHHKDGEVTIKLGLKQIGESNQVKITHKLSFVKPTKRGKATEESTSETPMHVNAGGKLTLFPENQGQLFGKNGEVEASEAQKS